MSNMGEGLYTVDSNGLVTSMNSAAEKLFGWTFDEISGRKMHDVTHYKYPDGTPFPAEDCAGFQVLHHGQILVNFEDVFIRKDGTFFDVQYSSSPLWENGSISGLVVVFSEITERKRAEKAIIEFARQQEALYKLADQLHRTNSLEDVFNAALDAISSALQCDRASILLFDNTGVMRFVAWRGLSDSYRKSTEGHSPWRPDTKNPEPVSFNDIGTAELSDSLKAVIEGEGIGSLAFIPLVSNGKLIGKFMAYFNAPHAFSEGELDLSLTIAHQLAFGIDRKRAEEALRTSEALYRAIARSIPGGGVYVVDKDFRYLVAEGPVTEAFGLSPEMLEGHTVSEIFPTEVGKRMKGRLQQNFAGETLSYETKHKGRIYWTQQAPLLDSLGHAIVVTIDITNQKRAEEALRESKERYYDLFNLVPVAVYTCDADGLIQEYNHRSVDLWGREPQKNDPNERFCGSFKIYYPDGRSMPHAACPMARMLRGETLEPHELEILVERPDGLRRNVIAHPLPLKNEHGEIVAAINCLYDITERKQAEQALEELNLQLESHVQGRTEKLNNAIEALREEISERKQAEELLRRWAHIFEHADWGIATIRQDTFMMVNPTYAKMHGYTAEELVGHSIYNVFSPESHADLREQIRIAYENGHHVYESKHIRKDGSIFPVLVDTTVVWDEDGNVLYRAVNVQDITERKRVEQELHESREHLQILSRRLVEVQEEERRAIARELHDRVGQTLAALNINLMIMNGQLLEDSKQRVGTRLDDSMHLVAEAIALVRNVMTDLRPAVLDDYGLEAALQSYIDEYKSRYGIKVVLDPPDQPIPRLGPSLEMTLLRITQEALFNIARHAQADSVNVSLRLQDNAVHLMVQDNGVGIQSWQEANRPGSHGLTIMRERADAFGGSLNVGSVPGRGTKVEVSIPLQNGNQNKVREEQ
jgi:PAS domain S-box-containing protein